MSRIIPRRGPLGTYEVQENGDLVVLDADGGRLVVLNAVGAAVYELADGERDVDGIADVICATLDAERARVRDDVERFVLDLAARGLVVIAEHA